MEATSKQIIEKKLFVYIPFYIARYEKELKTAKDYEIAIKDLEYFRDEMLKSRKDNQLDDFEMDDLRDCVNNIVVHITDGNIIESEVTSVMGGEIYELHSDRIIREATEPLKKELADKEKLLEDNQKQLADQEKLLEDNQKLLSDKNSEIAALRAEIEKLKSQKS
ncbi:MAG: hypothetical protein E7294_13830 [Lachnospiraceae bacterium]|nr:hypothetical protein [Lachnospiraceae bacterium]